MLSTFGTISCTDLLKFFLKKNLSYVQSLLREHVDEENVLQSFA